MDPITHTMTGAVLARSGLDRRGELPLAAGTLMLAANAPDIDVVALFLGSYTGLAFRRGWTHGPIAMVLLPFVVTGLVLAWHRWKQRRGETYPPVSARAILLLATVGVLSHPALDWLNTYGIRLLTPFSDKWFYGDAVFIVDPWLWLLLAAALVPWRRTRTRTRIFAAVAAGYVVAMVGGSVLAERTAGRAAAATGIRDIVEVMYQPAPALPFGGTLVVATSDHYMFGAFGWLSRPNRVTFSSDAFPRGDWTLPEVRRAMADPRVRDYLVWSRFPFVRVDRRGDSTAVFFGDARFMDAPASGSLRGVRVMLR